MPKLVFILKEGYSRAVCALLVEAFDFINAENGEELYTYRFIPDFNLNMEMSIPAHLISSVAAEREVGFGACSADYLFVIGGARQEKLSLATVQWVREGILRGLRFGAIGAGIFSLAASRLIDGRRVAVHWRDFPGFAESFADVHAVQSCLETDGRLITCAGGLATLDLVARIARYDTSDGMTSALVQHFVAGRIRYEGERQRVPLRMNTKSSHPIVVRASEIMESNLEQPLSARMISMQVGTSLRHFQRLFKREVHQTPSEYYRHMRLERAHLLLQTTDLAIIEITVACGFVSTSHFAKCYRACYGQSPTETRNAAHALPLKGYIADHDAADQAEQYPSAVTTKAIAVRKGGGDKPFATLRLKHHPLSLSSFELSR